MSVLRRFIVWTVLLIVVALLVGLGLLAGSLPKTSGTLAVSGLHAPVTIDRDRLGIPVITADSRMDAYFALGVAHAQDRLFQMEMYRRIASGRLAEVVGSQGLKTDRFMRTLGLRRSAEASLGGLSWETRSALDAYAAGVNAILESSKTLPPELMVLGIAPEPWTPVDSLLYGKLMGLWLSGNWMDEAVRVSLAGKISSKQLEDLWPAESPQDFTTATNVPTPQSGAEAARSLLASVPEEAMPLDASNAWVVSGQLTASGKPILASDPHLGFSLPTPWYLAIIKTPNETIMGGTFPGAPFILIGRNDALAWGLTTTHSDTADLFWEKPLEGGRYVTPQGPKDFTVRDEVITVRGGDSEVLQVRESRHGPLVNGILDVPDDKEARALALSAVFLAENDRTADAMFELSRAKSVTEAVAALRLWTAPQQNILLADKGGSIAYVAPGKVPVRAKGKGLLLAPGDTGEYDWTGWVPFESLPQSINPPTQRLINANNRPIANPKTAFLGAVWPDGYRAERIAAALDEAPAPLTPETMAGIQTDVVSLAARDLLPVMLKALSDNHGNPQLVEALASWDGTMAEDRAEPLLFSEWARRTQEAVFADELGDDLYRRWGESLKPRPLKAALAGTTKNKWCKPSSEHLCSEEVNTAFAQAITTLKEIYGPPDTWTWGKAHVARFEHPLLRAVPLLKDLVALQSAKAGDDFTINRGSYTVRENTPKRTPRYLNRSGAGLRAVFDLSKPDGAHLVLATGQSGHPLSRHFSDQFKTWLGRSLPENSHISVDQLKLTPLR